MMVVALTILGLSLFSLFSHEAQFFDRSLTGAQTLQFAMGGLDRSRFALSAASQNMSQAGANRSDGVIYARASQTRPGGIIDDLGAVLELRPCRTALGHQHPGGDHPRSELDRSPPIRAAALRVR